MYALAGTHWKGQLLTALPWDFYPETSWRDDMMLGATELARALQDAGHPAACPAGLPVRSAATYLRDAAALGQRLGAQQAGPVRHAEPV